MAFSMDVDELNREEVLQPLQPEPQPLPLLSYSREPVR